MKAKRHLRKPDTNRVTCHYCFARKCIMNFYWLTPFAYSFVNSDRLELVIYFSKRKNEPEDDQNAFMVNFADDSDLRRGSKARLRDFWDTWDILRDI